MSPPLTAWANFFAAEVGASAALTGLVVVAISINVSRILAFPNLPGRAAEALVTLIGAMVLTSLGLMPSVPQTVFGCEVLAIGLATFLIPVAIELRSFAAPGVPPPKRVLRAGMNLPPGLLFVVSGLLLAQDENSGLYWLAAGIIVSLIAGVWNTWVLLVEILR